MVYRIDLKRVILRKLVMGVADGVMEADGKPIYEAKDLRSACSTPRTWSDDGRSKGGEGRIRCGE